MSLWRRLLRAFDMLDPRGNPQFSKLVIVYIAGAASVQGRWSAVLAVALLAAAFGKSAFTAFLNRGQFTVSESLDVKKVEQVIRGRRTIDGIEETP